MSYSFGSDNHSGVHPQILTALTETNRGSAASYEMDDLSQELKRFLKNEFGAQDSFLVFTGTAANVLSLNACVRSFESIICTDISHLNMDECGAPEKFIGAKLIAVPHKNGKLTVTDIQDHLIRRGDQHASQVKAVSITQPTEYGTVYSLEELKEIKEFCTKEKLYLHIDGARLGNALYTLQIGFKDIFQFADVLSVGGTKNGLLFGELVVIMNPTLKDNFKYARKQALQLPSKTRFMAAQFIAYFHYDLWLEMARHQCEMAKYLAWGLQKISRTPHYAVESNAVFCTFSKQEVKALREEFFFYVWNEKSYECRLMTSFDTKKEDIDRFIGQLKTLNRGEYAETLS